MFCNRNWECDKPDSADRDSLTTLDAVPPGQHPSRMRPAERDGGSPSAWLTSTPNAGIMVYCAAHPNRICRSKQTPSISRSNKQASRASTKEGSDKGRGSRGFAYGERPVAEEGGEVPEPEREAHGEHDEAERGGV